MCALETAALELTNNGEMGGQVGAQNLRLNFLQNAIIVENLVIFKEGGGSSQRIYLLNR